MNKFANLVVHLNEDNIEEVKELLISKGEKLYIPTFWISKNVLFNYLFLDLETNLWYLTFHVKTDKEITLEEFKRLINEQKITL